MYLTLGNFRTPKITNSAVKKHLFDNKQSYLYGLNKAIVDSRLRPRYATHDVYLLIFIVEQNSVGIDAVVPAVTLWPLKNTHYASQSPLCEIVTSFTKPEVHNVLQCRQRRAEPGPQATCIKLVKFGRVVSKVCEGQTNRHTHHNTSQPSE